MSRITKFVADGRDMTDLFCWPPPSTGGGPVRKGTGLLIYPLLDKAEYVEKELRAKGTFIIEYYSTDAPPLVTRVRYEGCNPRTIRCNGQAAATMTLRVIEVIRS